MTAEKENNAVPAPDTDFLPPIETVCCGRKWFGLCGFCGMQDREDVSLMTERDI